MQHNSWPLAFIFLQAPYPMNQSLDHGPLPFSSFISSNQPTTRPLVLTTATKEGRSNRKNPAKKKNATTAERNLQRRKIHQSRRKILVVLVHQTWTDGHGAVMNHFVNSFWVHLWVHLLGITFGIHFGTHSWHTHNYRPSVTWCVGCVSLLKKVGLILCNM